MSEATDTLHSARLRVLVSLTDKSDEKGVKDPTPQARESFNMEKRGLQLLSNDGFPH